MNSNNPTKRLPVIIAGAGPCGLVAAVTLQKQNIPCVVYDRASREKLCSNAGSGFDMAPTAVDILQNKLCIDMEKAMRPYSYMYMADMKGRPITTYRYKLLMLSLVRVEHELFGSDWGGGNFVDSYVVELSTWTGPVVVAALNVDSPNLHKEPFSTNGPHAKQKTNSSAKKMYGYLLQRSVFECLSLCATVFVHIYIFFPSTVGASYVPAKVF